MAQHAVARLKEIEHLQDAGCLYQPIRHHLSITAFGVTAWTAASAGERIINEHDEDDPTADQELFLVLQGRAVFDIDGERVDAPEGTLAYEARGWELWAPLVPLYSAGRYAEVADRLGALAAASPQYPMLFFNLACCESRCGRTSDALDHLRQAIARSPELRQLARDDSDLDPIRDDPAFRAVVDS